MFEFQITTSNKHEIVDITGKVETVVREMGVEEGICVVYVPHATSALIINEYEPNLEQDMLRMFEHIIKEDNDYAHNKIDDNATAHLRSALFGPSVVLLISGGLLKLGTWQRILLCEFDGPRKRTVYVHVLGKP
ncbi:MAG: secondary thiamine-phosphate synthase enzyme YjbQ [Candidatus Micrarchaeia archaeon]